MNKLESIILQIQELPAEEQRAVVSEFAHLIFEAPSGVFELSDKELVMLDHRIANDSLLFTDEEVMRTLEEKYAADTNT